MLLPYIPELRLDVADRGVPNRERIVLTPTAQVDMSPYALIAGARGHLPGFASPLRDMFFWFGTGVVSPNDWIFLFTGSGNFAQSPRDDGRGMCWFFYWGKKTTIFHDPHIVPVLIRLNGLSIETPTPPPALPQ